MDDAAETALKQYKTDREEERRRDLHSKMYSDTFAVYHRGVLDIGDATTAAGVERALDDIVTGAAGVEVIGRPDNLIGSSGRETSKPLTRLREVAQERLAGEGLRPVAACIILAGLESLEAARAEIAAVFTDLGFIPLGLQQSLYSIALDSEYDPPPIVRENEAAPSSLATSPTVISRTDLYTLEEFAPAIALAADTVRNRFYEIPSAERPIAIIPGDGTRPAEYALADLKFVAHRKWPNRPINVALLPQKPK